MENKLLQPLLKAGLLELGDSDERLANIEKAIEDLEKKLKTEQFLLPAYTLVAIDPNINPDEPVLAEVEGIIAIYWKALRAKFTETPVPIIRAVIINSLYNIGLDDARVARIIYLTAKNFYPFAKLGREKDIIEQFITDLGEVSEKHANDEWALESTEQSIKLPVLKIEPLKIDAIKVDQGSLKKKIFEGSSRAHTGLASQNSQDEWAEILSQSASEGVANAIETSIENMSESMDLSAMSASINKFFTEFKKSLDQALKSSFTSIQAVERRSKLLWWKETLYSASLEDSYRSVAEIIQPIIMTYDLYQQLPSIVPVSVDYLLRDTVLLLNNKADDKLKLSDLLTELSKDVNIAILKGYFSEIEIINKRISITDFITLLLHGKAKVSTLKKYTGIDGKEKVSLNDIAVMILHDFMATYLIPKSK